MRPARLGMLPSELRNPKISRGKQDIDGQSVLKSPLATLLIPRWAEYDVSCQPANSVI